MNRSNPHADVVTGPGTRSQSFGPDGDHRQLANLRDLAGLRLTGGGTIPAGVLYRSDAPYLGDAVPRKVPVWPPATVIDLRSAGETPAEYRWPVGTSLHRIPLMAEAAIIGATADPARPARQLPASLEPLYRRMLKAVPQRLASLPAIAADSGGPVLVYCTAGKDRTGIAIAVLLLVGGAEPADIIADYTASAPNMAALLRRLEALGRSLPTDIDATSPQLGAPATAIGIVVDRLSGWSGGPAGWAQAHGTSAEDVRRWRAQLAGEDR